MLSSRFHDDNDDDGNRCQAAFIYIPSSFSSGFITPTKLSVTSPDSSTGTTISSTSVEKDADQEDLKKC
eukprot:11268714-Ditylum_brightwellii.AAC.1